MCRGFALALLMVFFGVGPASAQSGDGPFPVSAVAPEVTDEAGECHSLCCRPTVECRADCGPRRWVRAEYLVWWIEEAPLPVPLAHVGGAPFPGTIQENTAGASVILGNDDMDYGAFSGVRLQGGQGLGDVLAIETSIFLLETRQPAVGVQSNPDGTPLLARPFFDTKFGNEALFISVPGNFAGAFNVMSQARLWGAEANLAAYGQGHERFRVDLLGGFRFLHLSEDLRLIQSRVSVVNPSTTGFGVDRFHGVNQFFGGQIGARSEFRLCRLALGLTGKLAFGAITQSMDLSAEGPAGLLVQATNAGRHRREEFAVVPELEILLKYYASKRVQAFIGYNLLYVADVLRPGDHIDPVLDTESVLVVPRLIGGPPRPAFNFRDSDFWAQGLNFGVQIRF